MHIGRVTEVLIGTLAVIIAAVLGSYLTAKYTYQFQEELLVKQIEAQKQLFAEQKKFQEFLWKQQQDIGLDVEAARASRQQLRDIVKRSEERAMKSHK